MKIKSNMTFIRGWTSFLNRAKNWRAVFMIAITWMAIFALQVSAGGHSADGLKITTLDNGRVTQLEMGSPTPDQEIFFCDDAVGNDLTGGFYIRDNTLDLATNLPREVVNLIPESASRFDPGTVVGGNAYWSIFTYGDNSDVIELHLDSPFNNDVAKIEVDEAENPNGPGWYGGIYKDIEFAGSAPATHDIYYLTFEVKTECGWRSLGDPDGFGENGLATYGNHRVSAWVEWYTGDEALGSPPEGDLGRYPQSSGTYWDRFDAYETTENMDASGLTRFCGRTYRPIEANWARIVLIADGFMPNDGREGEFANEVYFDNVCFFKAPPIHQVEGESLIGGNQVALYKHGTTDPLNLLMTVDISPNGNHLCVSGELINVAGQEARAIDLGFALPILQDPGNQDLGWNYDVRNSILLNDASDRDKTFPFTFPGPIDGRPLCTSKGDIPTSKFSRYHNLIVSAYPISSLDIDQGGSTRYGLALGDVLWENDVSSWTPSISHFGYQITQPQGLDASFIGNYFVEFNIGLLGGAEQSTQFSFIIFRSDDPDFVEPSSFREGLQKYQRDIYPNCFNRPSNTLEDDWLFGGGFYPADPDDDGNWSGFDDAPNDYGLRYTQALGDFEIYLPFCETKNVGLQIYDRPWAGTFINDLSSTDESKNTYTQLGEERDNYVDHLSGGSAAIYSEKLEKVFKLPPGNQVLFASAPYGFPVVLADAPRGSGPPGDLVRKVATVLSTTYGNNATIGECFSGVELDNTFSDIGKSNHLDISGNSAQTFADVGGRLTYSFNQFEPAIPQLCTNVWLIPYLHTVLANIDGTTGGGDDSGNGNVEDEIISINANESDFGGSKYGILYADVIGFESNLGNQWNNGDHAFNFRRSLARDKSVSRQLEEVPCLSEALNTIFDDDGNGTQVHWAHDHDLFTQLVDEASWISLAWGFHPSISAMFEGIIEEYLGGDENFDRLVELKFHDLFVPGYLPADVGFTEIFRQLHLAGWQPITNVVNSAPATVPGAPNDPQKLFIERFGPYEGMGPSFGRPVYVTVLNNDSMTLTMTDVVDCRPQVQLSITDMASDLEVERSNICEDKYAKSEEYEAGKKPIVESQAEEKNKKFWLDIQDIADLGLDNFNLKGMQLVAHESNPDAVNSPHIRSSSFGYYGYVYSVRRRGTLKPFVRIGGPGSSVNYQEYGEIPDKALMVFKVWADNKVDNGGGGGGERDAEENPYYQRYGDWSSMTDENAYRSSVDVIPSTELNASALFSIDIGRSGRYDVRIVYPQTANGTSAAQYDVYFVERAWDDSGETESVGTEPVLTAIVDQSRRSADAMDEEGFISIGEIDVILGSGIDEVTVVVRVSSGGAEYRQGEVTLLMADAVKLEALNR